MDTKEKKIIKVKDTCIEYFFSSLTFMLGAIAFENKKDWTSRKNFSVYDPDERGLMYEACLMPNLHAKIYDGGGSEIFSNAEVFDLNKSESLYQHMSFLLDEFMDGEFLLNTDKSNLKNYNKNKDFFGVVHFIWDGTRVETVPFSVLLRIDLINKTITDYTNQEYMTGNWSSPNIYFQYFYFKD